MISFRERSPVLVGLVSLVLLTVAVGFAFSINRFQFLKGVYTIKADLADAAGVQPGNEVRLAGVRIGQVTDVSLTPETARVSMEVASDIDLPVETEVEVKLKTLLGQKFIDLQLPSDTLVSGDNGDDRPEGGAGFLQGGDVIPLEQTRIPFDIYQAATEGTAVLEEIDKLALRRLLNVLAGTFDRSKDELRNALVSLDRAGSVLGDKSPEISRLVRNLAKVTGTLGDSGGDLEGILDRSAEVLGTLAERRSTISSLLAATNDLGRNLGQLIQVARGSVELGVADLNSLLTAAESEIDSIDEALAEFGIAQKLFAAPGGFGRFLEGHACAVTTADTCVPSGTPQDPGLPVHGKQPERQLDRRVTR